MTRLVVLDHGYVEPIDQWGSDERIIEAARMSTAKGFQGWGTPDAPGDEKLLRFLWENKHQTPFEMAGLTIEVQAPIFVFREWHRHRVPFGYNEMSARYTPLPDVNYIPSVSNAKKEAVNHPAHYKAGGLEAIDVIEAFGLGFCLGNTVKYVLRAGRKGDALEDLGKARWYLDREIASRKAARS